MTWFDDMQVSVPEGQRGDWKVERFTIDAEQARAFNLHALVSATQGHGYRSVKAGSYTRLTHRGEVWMSDTPIERFDNADVHLHAHGQILFNGLGLGAILQACLRKHSVEHATVIELSQEVIGLVGPHYQAMFGDRLTIIHADALEYKPTQRYQMVWHDIWQVISIDNLPDIRRLHYKWGHWSDWQGSWCREMIKREQRRYNAETRMWREW